MEIFYFATKIFVSKIVYHHFDQKDSFFDQKHSLAPIFIYKDSLASYLITKQFSPHIWSDRQFSPNLN